MLIRRIVILDGVDRPVGRHLLLDLVEERDEFPVPMALGVAANNRFVRSVQRGEQSRGPFRLQSCVTNGLKLTKSTEVKIPCRRGVHTQLPWRRRTSVLTFKDDLGI